MDFQRHTAAVSLQTRIRLLSTPVQDHYLLVFSSLQTTLSFSDSSFMIYQAEILPRLPRAFFKWAVLFHSLPNITITFSFQCSKIMKQGTHPTNVPTAATQLTQKEVTEGSTTSYCLYTCQIHKHLLCQCNIRLQSYPKIVSILPCTSSKKGQTNRIW